MEQPLISIIIVNYNSGTLLMQCIKSISEFVKYPFEVIIYDNASADDSIQIPGDHPALSILRGEENLGFAKANNRAAAKAKGQFLHFLNPDIEVDERINTLYQEILDKKIKGVWVTALTDPSGHYEQNKMVIPRLSNIARRLFHKSNVQYWSLGASLIMNRHSFDQIGGWPEDYFMYAEDLDLFYCCHSKGIPVNFSPVPVMHIGGGVTYKIWNPEQRATIIEKSFRKFYRKYHAGWEYYLVRPLQLVYILFNDRSQFWLYARVFMKNLTK